VKPNAVVHSFSKSLDWANTLKHEPSWVAFYKAIWPNMLQANRLDADSPLQRTGVDRIIYLRDGREFRIDEKIRNTDYTDVLLEVWSVCRWDEANRSAMPTPDGHKKPGWARDTAKRCDFVAYAIPRRSLCYLLPFELTRLALLRNGKTWSEQREWYPKVAYNEGYDTVSIAVPYDTLRAAINEEMRREFAPDGDLPAPVALPDQTLRLQWDAPTEEEFE
jgi:hypothetical protein